MADNFNFKQFLMENRLGAYSKAGMAQEADETPTEDSNTGGDALADGEAIGGFVITPDKTDPQYTRVEFDVQGFTQNGSRQINYELTFFPATKRITARNKKESTGRTQSAASILKGGGYVDLGTDNVSVPTKYQDYLKKYAI